MVGGRVRGIKNFISFNQGFFEEPETYVAYFDLTEDQTEFGIFKKAERRDSLPA